MAYILAQPCIGVKDKSCVNVCPVKAIFTQEELPAQFSRFINKNKLYFEGKNGEGKNAVRQGKF